MNFDIPADVADLVANIHRFMNEHVYTLEGEPESPIAIGAAAFPPAVVEVQKKAKQLGYWAFHLPAEGGGAGIPFLHYAYVNEVLGRSPYGPACMGSQAPDSGNAEILYRWGSSEQKQRWMAPLVAGDVRSCFSMTEPETAGSDPKLLRGSARRDGDHWVINKHAWFSSGAHGAAFAIVMVVTSPDAAPHQRQSMIMVPLDTPGVNIVRGIPVMGENLNHHAEISYEDVRVPLTNMLGPEGSGFLIAQERLGPGRIHHCMRWLGQAQRAFELMCQRAVLREAFGSTLSRKANIQDWIAEARADILAARLMTLYAAHKIDKEGPGGAREEISMIKFFGAKVLHSVIDKAVQIYGAEGVTEDGPLSMMYRHARFARIYDGPDEVHKMVVARRILAEFEKRATAVA